MPEEQLQDVLAELGALRREVATYRAAHEPQHPRRTSAGLRARLIATVTLTLLVALVPLALLAAGPFTDLDPASPHNDNIEAIRQAGITKGCNPPDFTQYCPNDFVTRQEMASFLARTAGLGGNPPVVNALTAQTATTVVDGAITPAKLSATGSTAGQVLTSTGAGIAWQNPPAGGGAQGPQGPAGLQGPQGLQGPPGVTYARTVIVSPIGTDAQNGTALLNALAGINASAVAPYLLKIEPGIYDLGATSLPMKQYVDIEGSGASVTRITGNTNSNGLFSTGTVLGANNAELRSLTVANTSATANKQSAAVYLNNVAPRLVDVTLTNGPAGSFKAGLVASGGNARPILDRVTITVSNGDANYGIYGNNSAFFLIYSSTISGAMSSDSFGIFLDNAGASIRNSIVSGGTIGIRIGGGGLDLNGSHVTGNSGSSQSAISVYSGATVNIGSSLLQGTPLLIQGGAPVIKCVFTYSGGYVALNASCS